MVVERLCQPASKTACFPLSDGLEDEEVIGQCARKVRKWPTKCKIAIVLCRANFLLYGTYTYMILTVTSTVSKGYIVEVIDIKGH